MAITSILNTNRLLLSKRTVNCFDGNILSYNVIKSLSFRPIIPNPNPKPKLISLQAKTFTVNSTTPILTTSSSKRNSRIPCNLNEGKVQQSVGVMMGGRSFPLILTNPNPNPNRWQVPTAAALCFTIILVGGLLLLLILFSGPQQRVLDLNHFLMETTKSLCLGRDIQHWISDYSPVTMSMSMLLAGPKRIKFPKQHRGRMRGKASRGNLICFGRYALQALEPAWITARQIEAGRRAMVRNVKRGGKIWVRIFPDKPVTARPAETRMGSGKGSHAYWVAVIRPGKIIYEMSGVPENIARKAISMAASKMPIKTKFIISAAATSKDD